MFPGGSGRLRLVRDEQTPRAVLGGQSPAAAAEAGGDPSAQAQAAEAAAEAEADAGGALGRRGRGGRDGRGDRDHARGQVDQAPVAALGRGEVDDRAGVPVRGVPRAPVPVLHPRRGRGGARRPQPRPLPGAAAPLLRPGPVHRDHPSEAHDGGGGLAVWGVDGRKRRFEGALTQAATRGDGGRGRGGRPPGRSWRSGRSGQRRGPGAGRPPVAEVA